MLGFLQNYPGSLFSHTYENDIDATFISCLYNLLLCEELFSVQ